MGLLPGHLAVFGFFLISGFVLRLSLERGPQSIPTASARFLISRLCRFIPIVATGVLFVALSATTLPSFGTVAANVVLLDVSLNPPLWSLQVELLVIPLVLALYFTERCWGPRPVALVALITTGLAFCPTWAIWRPLSTSIFVICVGMLIPTYGRQFAIRLSRRAANTWLIVSALIFAAASPCLGPYSRFTEVIGGYSGSVVLSLAAHRTDLRPLRLLDLGLLRMAGRAAGSIYVLHMMTAPAMISVAAYFIPAAWSQSAPAFVGIGVITGWLLAITPVMLLVTRLIEEPGVAFGRRITRTLRLNVVQQRNAVVAMPGPNCLAA